MGVGALFKAARKGDENEGCFPAGQIAGMVNQPDSAEHIVHRLISEAELVLKGAQKWVK